MRNGYFWKKSVLVVFILIFSSGYTHASSTGIILDIFDIQLDALSGVTGRSSNQVMQQESDKLNTVMDLYISEIENSQWENGNRLVELTDEIGGSVINGYGSELNTANDLINVGSTILDMISVADNAKDIFKNSTEAISEMSELIKRDKDGTILRNLLEYGAGNRNIKYENMLDGNTLLKDYKNIYNFVKNLDSISNDGTDTAEKLFALLFEGAKQEILEEKFKNTANIKITIQETIIKTALENSTITDEAIEGLKNQNIYTLDEGFWFFPDSLNNDTKLDSEYLILTSEERYHIEAEEAARAIESGNEDDTPVLGANEEENEELEEKSATNPDNEEDPNKAKLANLKSKDKELKSNIKSLQEKEDSLKTKKERLFRINQEKKDTLARVNNEEKGSDEWKSAFSYFVDLVNEKHSILNEINKLTNSINSYQTMINNLQTDIKSQMSQLDDTVDDYLNSAKVDIATNNQQSTRPLTWLGTITYNSENKSDGKLRYWGGRFDSDIAEAAKAGGGLINTDYGWTITNGEVKNIYATHGTNTETDTTKEFYIANSDISTNPAFYDTNIKTLKIQKNLPNGNTLKFEATGHYEYTAWGNWGQTGGLITDVNGGAGVEQMALHNNWSVGQETHDLPVQGSATYNGVVSGNWYQGSVGSAYGGKIDGTMAMTVDFANTSVVSGTLNLNKVGGGAFVTATMDQMQINRTEGGFAGTLVGANVDNRNNNNINGQFNGPNAEEISGAWSVDNTSGEFASGVFAGQR